MSRPESERHDHPPLDGGYTGVYKPPSCNRHSNCDEAKRKCIEKGGNPYVICCHAEDCEECFGS